MAKSNGNTRISNSSSPRGLSDTEGSIIGVNTKVFGEKTELSTYDRLNRTGMADFLNEVVEWGIPVRPVLDSTTFKPTFDGGVKKTKTGYVASITLNIGDGDGDQFPTVKAAEDRVLSVLNAHKADLDKKGVSYKMSYREPAFDSNKLTISFAQKHVPGYKRSSKWTD